MAVSWESGAAVAVLARCFWHDAVVGVHSDPQYTYAVKSVCTGTVNHDNKNECCFRPTCILFRLNGALQSQWTMR